MFLDISRVVQQNGLWTFVVGLCIFLSYSILNSVRLGGKMQHSIQNKVCSLRKHFIKWRTPLDLMRHAPHEISSIFA